MSAYGENGWLLNIADADVMQSSRRSNAIANAIRNRAGVTDAVAGLDSVAIRFDENTLPSDAAQALLFEIAETAPVIDAKDDAKTIDLPVRYGGEDGPDLAGIADRLSITPDDVIEMHLSQTYETLLMGFAPGFGYLGLTPPELDLPRRPSPRPRLPAGSIGIAGRFTGVYSLASPGGWNIIGRTLTPLFDPARQSPFLLKPGMQVRFTRAPQS